jgi:pantoate kinase
MKIEHEEISVKVPHRLTGFFEIVDTERGERISNPERIGSRGAGISLSGMGKTTIKAKESHQIKQTRCNIYINGKKLNEEAETSYYIFNHFKDLIEKPNQIEIFHKFDLPVGCGYGASGSGALGVSYGLNELFDLGLSPLECGRIAHISEVINKTGLGTICGLLCSGLCVLTEPGYPCTYKRISVPNDIRVICTSFGEISTKSILSDKEFQLKIKKAGKLVLKKFLSNPNIATFMALSHEFIEKTELLEILGLEETKSLIVDLNKEEIIGASMNQLGRSVFAVCREQQVEKVLDVFKSHQSEDKIFNLKVYEQGIEINR